jgi:hypothetical protein
MAHENGKKCTNHEFFYDFLEIVWRGPRPFKTPKACAIAHEMARNARNHEFSMISGKSCDGVPDHLNPWRTPKPCAITHENGQKCPKSRFFYDFVKIVWRVPDHLNPRRTPKLCAIAHENGQKCPKSWVFYDLVKIMWRGPGPFKSTSDHQIVCYIPRKWPEMQEIKSFLWFRENRATVSWTI